jgi:general secretion pathway protein C
MLSSLSPADQARLSRLTALAVCAIAAAVCLWLLVRLAWLLVPATDEVVTAPSKTATSTLPPVQSVAKWHLFGNPQGGIAAQAAHAPTTTLKLVLRGTLALADARQGIAMIEDEHGGERAYKVGEEVSEGAKLAEVYADHVVLSREGASETLNLPQPEAHAPEAANTAAAATKSAAAGTSATKASSIPPNYAPPQMARGAAADWTRMQKNMRLDPAELAKQVHVEPVYENGKLAGARLSAAGQLGALISQAGLKATDTITAVNGASVTDLSKLQQMTDNLQTASSLQVTVLRDGKPATLTVNLR